MTRRLDTPASNLQYAAWRSRFAGCHAAYAQHFSHVRHRVSNTTLSACKLHTPKWVILVGSSPDLIPLLVYPSHAFLSVKSVVRPLHNTQRAYLTWGWSDVAHA